MSTYEYPSLELCKKLTEAEFPQTENTTNDIHQIIPSFISFVGDKIYVCPSVMELLNKMPNRIIVNYKNGDIGNYKLEIGRQGTSESTDAYYVHYVEGTGAYSFMLGPLPNALAEMWLWLKENGYLSIK